MYQKICNVMLDVNALKSLLEKMTLDGLGGADENPCIGRLVYELSEFLNDVTSERPAYDVAHIKGLDPLAFPIVSIGSTLTGQPVELFTVADLLGYGALSSFNENTRRRFTEELQLRGYSNYSQSGRDYLAQWVMFKAVDTGSFGPKYTSDLYDELSGTAYSVPPDSTTETIVFTYTRMAGDALSQFDRLVMPYVHFMLQASKYLYEDEEN